MAHLRNPLVRSCIAEFLGTFFLVLSVAAAAVGMLTPFAAGFVLLTQVFTYGYISGGLYNPAVALGVMIAKIRRGAVPLRVAAFEFGVLIVTQFVAGILGGLVGDFLSMEGNRLQVIQPTTTAGLDVLRTYIAEFAYTTLLVSTVLHVAVAEAHRNGNHFYGLAIGMSLFAGAATVANISGAAFNPAVSFGVQVADCAIRSDCHPLSYFWLYFLAHFPAAILASVLFELISPVADNEYNDLDKQFDRNVA